MVNVLIFGYFLFDLYANTLNNNYNNAFSKLKIEHDRDFFFGGTIKHTGFYLTTLSGVKLSLEPF